MTNENNPNLTEMIREIHDGVAREMYCKGIDDFAAYAKSIRKKKAMVIIDFMQLKSNNQ